MLPSLYQERLPAAAPSIFYRPIPGNLLQNAGFEQNWFNRNFAQARRFLLLQASDLGMAEADGHIDDWRVEGARLPDCWDTTVARSGARSLRFDTAGSAYQRVRFAGEQYWRAGGAYYAEFLPMAHDLALQLARRPIVVGAWCKTQGVPAGAEPQLAVHVDGAARANYEKSPPADQSKADASAAFSAGTHDWEYREARIDPDQLKGTPFFVTVRITAAGKGGITWFDDVSCTEPPSADQPNRVANAGFEALDAAGWPREWQPPVPWTWFRNDYYTFTGWSHSGDAKRRGGAAVDRTISFAGGHSLRFDVLPGDNFAVGSAPIELDQDRPRPLEARAMVRADNLRTLEIMAQDEKGEWLPQGDFLGDDVENNPDTYNMGSTGSGSYDWTCVRKYFSPRRALRSVRLFLCARGFDGAIAGKNVVGTAWFDDVELFEHGVSRPQIPARLIPAQPPAAPAGSPFKVLDLDLGDRLWGRNRARLVLELPDERAAGLVRSAALELRLTDPAGGSRSFRGGCRIVRPPRPGRPGYAVASALYELETLCRSWQEQYRLSLRLIGPQVGRVSPGEFQFGTPSRLITAGTSAYYPYPGETLSLYANLNVARDSFAELARCDLVAASGGKERTILQLRDFTSLLRPQTAPDYIDTSRIVQARLGSDGFTVHPWSEPARDSAFRVRLYGNAGGAERLLAESEPVRFGWMERIPPPDLPAAIRKTAVNERGYLTVNGRPFFPVYWTPDDGVVPGVNYPPRRFGFKSIDLTEILYAKGKMPDDEAKSKLLARVAQVKNDPKFFQYELGEGEMQLQGDGWKERNEWLKRAIPWIRAADPNHLINGPESWLVGHPGHDEAMKAFVPHFDAIGVEASFEDVPRIREALGPLMTKRKTAVLVGLETYFYQPLETLCWRGYRSVLNGAAGIGLCPSGMLQARPDRVNFLRGLNGEFRGLAPIITASAPPDRVTCNSSLVETMERLYSGKRYLFTARSDTGPGAVDVKFAFPPAARYTKVRALFEDRSLPPARDGFQDRFAGPRVVHVYEME